MIALVKVAEKYRPEDEALKQIFLMPIFLPSTFQELSNTNKEYYFSWLFLRMD